MTGITEVVLTESKSARTEQLANMSNERAEKTLNKVKSLFFAVWEGTNFATTQQMADFYEVPEASIRQALSRHSDEFEFDGVKLLKNKSLRDVRDILSLTSKAPQATVWTPRAALRLGMLLRDSEIAKQVRTTLLDAVEHFIPAQAASLPSEPSELDKLNAEARRFEAILSLARLDPKLAAASLGVELTPKPGRPKVKVKKSASKRRGERAFLDDVIVDDPHLYQFIQDSGLIVSPSSRINVNDLWKKLRAWYIEQGILECRGKKGIPEWSEPSNELERYIKGPNQIVKRFSPLFPEARVKLCQGRVYLHRLGWAKS